jgi:ubiquinone/menaquinone biosynthesis C-methylase UbiE
VTEDDLVREHYKKQAAKWGNSAASTMEDEIVRKRETELISNFINILGRKKLEIADIGCGNGYTLDVLSAKFPGSKYWGIDFSEELITIAKNRNLANCEFIEGSACSLNFDDNFFDVVYTQRCLINILNWDEQKKALDEIHRVIKPNGYYLMMECFTDGLINNNRARTECGLSELKEAYHNKYFQKELFFNTIKSKFTIMEPNQLDSSLPPFNFLSSHYFIARVLHALVTQGEQIKNTEFVNFFSYLPPIGNYSPIQAYILRKVKNAGDI